MLNAILNGGLGKTSSSSRSGTSTTTTYTIATPSGTATNLTLEQYNQLKDALAKYNDAYGIAYSYDLPAPDWNKFTAANAQSIVDDYAKRAIESGKTSKSESWAAFAAERYAATVAPSVTEQPTVTQPTELPEMVDQHYATPIFQKCVEYAQANNFPLPSFQWVESFGSNALPKLEELVAWRDRTGVNLPNPYAEPEIKPAQYVSVAPSEEKGGSGLLIPGIFLALGVIGAIALSSKSKKRR